MIKQISVRDSKRAGRRRRHFVSLRSKFSHNKSGVTVMERKTWNMRATRRYGVVAVLTLSVCSQRRYQWPMLDPRHCLSNKPFLLTIFSKQEHKNDSWYCGGSHIGLDCCGCGRSKRLGRNWINLGITLITINNWDITENIRKGSLYAQSSNICKIRSSSKKFSTNRSLL